MPNHLRSQTALAVRIHEEKNRALAEELKHVHTTFVADEVARLLHHDIEVSLLTGASTDAVKMSLKHAKLEHMPVLGHGCNREMKLFLLKNLAVSNPVLYVDDRADMREPVESLGVKFFHYDDNIIDLEDVIDQFLFDYYLEPT